MKKHFLLLSVLVLAAFTFTSCDLFETEEDDEDYLSTPEELDGETITSNVIWETGTYIIKGSLTISGGGHLTIPAGTTIKFESGGKIVVTEANSGLTASGSADFPIKFTSVSNNASNGDWDYINFTSTATGNSELSYCIIEYGGGYATSYGGTLWVEGAKISVDNCTFKNSGAHGVVCEDDGYFNSFTNNTLMNNTLYDIHIDGNYAHTIGTGNNIEGQGIYMNGDVIEQANATWLLQTAPYTIDGSMHVNASGGASLTIEAGNTIQFTDGSDIRIGGAGNFGTLKAQGTAELPITFTSSSIQKDYGQWDYIEFETGATSNSILEHCIVEAAGGYADYVGAIHIEDSYVSIKNTEIRKSATYGITVNSEAYFAECTDNNIPDCQSYAIQIAGNSAHTIGTGNTYEDVLGIEVYSGTIDQNEVTWKAQTTPYVLTGNLRVESSSASTLIIEPGSTLKFTDGNGLYIGAGDFGKLIANGTQANPITFTTAAPSGGEQPGQWDGIFFEENTLSGSVLNYCSISYGGGYADNYYNGNINLLEVPVLLPEIKNCTISYSSGWGIYSDGSSATLENNTFIGNNLGDIGNKKGMMQ
jgi:parallel beta-helix repeat protein